MCCRLYLDPNHLRDHIFKHSFQDTLSPLCYCGMGIESLSHFLLLCPLFINKRCTLMKYLNKIDPEISKFNLSNLRNTLLFRKSSFIDKINIFEYVATNLNPLNASVALI